MANEFFIGSIKRLSELLKVEYADAAGYVRILVGMGLAREAGKEPKAAGVRGKGSTLWALPWSVTIEIPKEVVAIAAAPPELPDDLMGDDSNLPQSPSGVETTISEDNNGELAAQNRVESNSQASF